MLERVRAREARACQLRRERGRRLDVLQLAAQGCRLGGFLLEPRLRDVGAAARSAAAARAPATDSRVARSSASLASLASRAISRTCAICACVAEAVACSSSASSLEFSAELRARWRLDGKVVFVPLFVKSNHRAEESDASPAPSARGVVLERDATDATRAEDASASFAAVSDVASNAEREAFDNSRFFKTGVPASDENDDDAALADAADADDDALAGARLGSLSFTSAGVGGAATGLRRIASSVSIGFLSATSARTFATHSFASARVAATRKTSREASLSGSACLRSRHTHRPAYDLLPWKFTEDTNAPLMCSTATCDSAFATPGDARNVKRAPAASRDTQRLFHRFKCSDRFNIHIPAIVGQGASA